MERLEDETVQAYVQVHVVYISRFTSAIHNLVDTVDSRYLKIEGTLKNTSRYPYFDISD